MSSLPPDLLKQVSRSFYLSLQVLPQEVRPQMGLAYLLARAADTIADTPVLPAAERRSLLLTYLSVVRGQAPVTGLTGALLPLLGDQRATSHQAERQLLQVLGPCVEALHGTDAADRALIQRVLEQLMGGMERDLLRFPAAPAAGQAVPPGQVVALRTLADLDDYTYFAAGCVGEFWTDLCAQHLPELAPLRDADLRRRGINLGKGLQLVNVIRDAPQDLLMGRCYWPTDLLTQCGLRVEQLAELARVPGPAAAVGPSRVREDVVALTRELIRMAQELFRSAWPYVQAIPARLPRLRLACTWPLLIGQDTLAAVRAEGSPLLVPWRAVKVRRRQVYQVLLRSSAAALQDWVRGGASGRLDTLLRG